VSEKEANGTSVLWVVLFVIAATAMAMGQDTTYATTSPLFVPHSESYATTDLGVLAPIRAGISVQAGVNLFRQKLLNGRSRLSMLVSFVPYLERRNRNILIRRGVADSGSRNRNAQVIWIQYTHGFPSWTSPVRIRPPDIQ
jgi:hypothetical protein